MNSNHRPHSLTPLPSRAVSVALSFSTALLSGCNSSVNSVPSGACVPVSSGASDLAAADSVPVLSQGLVQGSLSHISPAVKNASDLGKLSDDEELRISVLLKLNHEDELDQRIAQVYQVGHPNYHQFMTPGEFRARYSPTEDQISKAREYLESQGIHTTSISSNGVLIHASGSARALSTAFQTEIHQYQAGSGPVKYAPAYEPTLPSDLSIQAVNGLESFSSVKRFSRPSDIGAVSADSKDSNGISGLTPSMIRTAYHIPSQWSGQGQTLALVELDGYESSDIAAYASEFGLGSPSLTHILVDGATGQPGPNSDEVTLDIELALSIAPAAQILVYEAPNTSQDLLDLYSEIANDGKPKQVVSISWGLDESEYSTSYLESESASFRQMAVEGMSVFSASGDEGAYENGSTVSVADPAAQPFVVAVGGTHLSLSSSGEYASETTWNSGSASNGASGGGISQNWSIPSWQTGVANGSNAASSTMRNIPDVSLNADPLVGYAIFLNGTWTSYGGTSCATPLWAAFTAIVNEQRQTNGLGPLGFPNPALYAIGQGSAYSSDFHDIDDDSSNLLFYAVPGFDDATGWGSFNGQALFNDLTKDSVIASSSNLSC